MSNPPPYPIVPSPIPGFPSVTANPEYGSNGAENPWLGPRILHPQTDTHAVPRNPEPMKGGKRTNRKRSKRKRSRRKL